MSMHHRGPGTLAAFVALCAMLAILTAGAASALAMPKPLPNDDSLPIQQPPITVEHVSNGSPIWVFVVVAAVTALVSVATVLAASRLRQARRSTAYA